MIDATSKSLRQFRFLSPLTAAQDFTQPCRSNPPLLALEGSPKQTKNGLLTGVTSQRRQWMNDKVQWSARIDTLCVQTDFQIAIDNINMLSSAALEQNAENRRSEKTLFTMQQLELKITKSIYQDLISWLVETCDSLGLQPTTRYLSRAYFDEVVRCGQKGQASWWAAVAVTCISVAIKFNEVRQVADRYAPEYLLRFTESDISGDQYFVLEIKVLTVLRMRFKLTTPYDYFPYFFARFPWLQCTREAINDLLHLAVALPNTYSYSAEELFYACVRAIFLYKAVQLTELQISVFSSMTDSWGKSKGLSLEILGVIQSFMEPSPNN